MYLYIEIIYNSWNKSVLILVCNRMNVLLECKTEQRTSQGEHGQPMEQTIGLFCTCDSVVTTPVSLLANKLDVWSVLHGQVSLAAVNQIFVTHEAMNGCKNLKVH